MSLKLEQLPVSSFQVLLNTRPGAVLHLTDDDGGASGGVVTVIAAAPTAELVFRVWAGPGPGSGVLGSVALAGLGVGPAGEISEDYQPKVTCR